MAGVPSDARRSSLLRLTPPVLALAISACGLVRSGDGSGSPEATIPPSPPFTLATPVSQEPAAGICGSSESAVVEVTLYPDIPDPRCARVRPEQVLRVVNRTQASLEVRIGPFATTLEPGEVYELDVPFGAYLAPGVHPLLVVPCCGPEVWLRDDG